MKLQELYKRMIVHNCGDAKRIQHFIKVHSLSKLIGEMEGLGKEELEILETAAFVHDIGIRPAVEKYGYSNGKLQEQEGPEYAEKLLKEIGFSEKIRERVCYLVAHHHTYDQIDGMDYQILVEADFLVNLYEHGDEQKAIQTAYQRIFKTKSGKWIFEMMFQLQGGTE